ncbi:hypothetical protein [Micromonospora chokoriensis]
MTTPEKITAGIALLGALGVGALLKSWIDHLLGRRERRIDIADKSVQMADTMMTRMEGELIKTIDALAKTQREGEELRAELASTTDVHSARELELSDQLHRANKELARARTFVEEMRRIDTQLKAGLAEYKRKYALIAAGEYSLGQPESPPVAEDVQAAMVHQHEEAEYRRGAGRGGGMTP